MKEDGNETIGDSTRVRMGLLIIILGFCCGGAWWAATIKARVDTLVDLVARYQANSEKDSANMAQMITRMEKLEWRLSIMEKKLDK